MTDKSRPISFPLRLPLSMRRQAIEIAQREGLSLNQFISLAVAEKITRLEQTIWFERRNHTANGQVNASDGTGEPSQR